MASSGSSNRKFFIMKTGNTLNSHEDFIRHLHKQIQLQEVFTVDECDFILGFCPVISRAGINVERALDKLQNISDTKFTVLVVLHHTFDPECIVQDSNRTVNLYCKINTIAVDCLFHEDKGLLQCHKNDESLFTTSTYIKSLNIQAMLREVKEKCGESERNLEKNQMELKDKERQLESVMKELETSKNKLIERDKQLQEKDRLLTEKSETLEMKEAALEQNETLLKQIQSKFDKTVKELEDSQRHMEQENTQLENMNKQLSEKEIQLKNTDKELETSNNKLETLGQELQDEKRQLEEMMIVLEQQKTELSEKNKQLEETERRLTERETQLMERDKQLQEKDKCLTDNQQTLQVKDKTLEEKDTLLREVKEELDRTNHMLEENQSQLREKERQLESVMKELDTSKTKLKEGDKELQEKDRLLNERTDALKMKDKTLEEKDTLLREVKEELGKTKRTLEENQTQLKDKERQLESVENELESSKSKLTERDKQLQEKDRLLEEKTKQLQEQTDPESSAAIRRRNSKEALHPYMSGETQDSAAPIRRRNSMEGRRPTLGGESSSPHSPLSVPVAELRLVLLGRTGSGKSAAGNTILSREERNQAATSTATSTSTQQSESTQGEVAGRKVTVVDTPDWFSPGLSLEKLRQDVGLCVHLSAPGPHAFLLVIPVKQPTGEERGMLEKMEEIFGERCWRNTMIIFSVTDELQKKNIEEFIQSGNQEVQRLMEKCGNRFHCLNNNESGDGCQVTELLEKIEKMVEGSRVKFYSSEIYLETESQIRVLETKILKEREEKRIRVEMEVKEKLDEEVQDSLRKIEGVIQEHEGDIRQLNDRTTELERKMKEERDEEKKKELERELKREVERRTETEEKVKKLKEKRERERREMEERHQQEMEEIREVYEGEVRMETERNLMKIILPELQRNILASKTKMQEEFSRQMEEKNRELETLKQKLSDLTETHSLCKEVYGKTVSSSESERAAVTGEVSKGIFQTLTDYFVTG